MVYYSYEQISSEAVAIACGYRKQAGRLQAARISGDRPAYVEASKQCDDWQRRLMQLAESVFRSMPEIAIDCRVVSRLPQHYHHRTDADWDGLVAELKTIAVAADAAHAEEV